MLLNTEDVESLQSDYYDFLLTPITAAEDCKNGVTFRGSDEEYFKAHKIIGELTKHKGDKYVIKGVEISIADAPQNKPATISIKTKNGITGKANIKIYYKNKRGTASILVTKVRGGAISDVSNLAFRVIKPLLDDIISGDITAEDINKMKRNKINKEQIKISCEKCGEIFPSEDKLDVHIKTHSGMNEIGELCGDSLKSKEELKKHRQEEHNGVCSPNAKRLKEETQIDKEKDINNDMEMDIDDETLTLSKLNDEKVLKLQKRFEEEQNVAIENKRKKEEERLEEERKAKVKRDSEKKKNKKKEQLERNKGKKDDIKQNRKEIDRKFSGLMKEAGLNIEEYCIWSVEPDGACGSTCTAVHCHRDRKLGKYVRRNINEYLNEFWPFFKPHFQFPLEVRVGLTNREFQDDKSFLDFLKKDQQSGLVWMDHFGLQIVSNMYQISIHVLSTGVPGLVEPRARWTHIEPDTRLSSFSTVHKGLADMWLIHVDEIHFDLLIRKDSELAMVGCVDEMEENALEESNEKKVEEKHEDHGPGYMGWRIQEDKEIVQDAIDYKKELADLKSTVNTMRTEFVELKCDFQKRDKALKQELKGVKEDLKNSMESLKEETIKRNEAETLVKVLKNTIEVKQKLEENKQRQEKCLNSETTYLISEDVKEHVINHKEIIKTCNISDIRAEEKNEMKKHEQIEHGSVKPSLEDTDDDFLMDIDQSQENQWEQQKRNNRKRTRSLPDKKALNCDICKKEFKTNSSLESHKEGHRDYQAVECKECKLTFVKEEMLSEHQQNVHKKYNCESSKKECVEEKLLIEHRQKHSDHESFKCDICNKIFHMKEELWAHGKEHEGHEFDCQKCAAKFLSTKDLKAHVDCQHTMLNCKYCENKYEDKTNLEQHMKDHNEEISDQVFSCTKCEKKYGDMRKLRRHDWRSHRTIECTLCGEQLESRESITKHRQTKHRIFKIGFCKYYPTCYDEDECFFQHDDQIKSTGCPNGINCKDQSCQYGEKEHKSLKTVLCKFQENCNRGGCPYIHVSGKSSFLKEGASQIRKK